MGEYRWRVSGRRQRKYRRAEEVQAKKRIKAIQSEARARIAAKRFNVK
jgi:hypothetical protein